MKFAATYFTFILTGSVLETQTDYGNKCNPAHILEFLESYGIINKVIT